MACDLYLKERKCLTRSNDFSSVCVEANILLHAHEIDTPLHFAIAFHNVRITESVSQIPQRILFLHET
jgi:hypothetical protein